MKRLLSMRKLVVAVSAAVVLAWGGTANASSMVFTTSGANSVSGKATFNFLASSFTVTLENLTNPLSLTAQELDGLVFTLASSGNPTLTSVSAAGILDCSGDPSFPCNPYAGVVPVDDGWGVSTSGGVSTLTTTPLGFHPYAIIDANYTLPASGNGNLANPQHNPFLLGPVVFSFTGSFTDASNVTFDWGTQPYTTAGTCVDCTVTQQDVVPEPASLLLLGSGLTLVARKVRRRRQG